jgi:hypothetical protein
VLAGKLRDEDWSVLNELCFANRGSQYPMEWCRPLDVGGHNSSHHSASLAKMVRYGFVESRQRSGHMSRGSKVYKITEAGVLALRSHLEKQ